MQQGGEVVQRGGLAEQQDEVVLRRRRWREGRCRAGEEGCCSVLETFSMHASVFVLSCSAAE